MAKKIVKSRFYFEEGFQEHLAEVSTDSPKSWGDNDTLEIVGKPVSRIDGYDKVSGTAVYAFDKISPKMTYARTLRCPHPHAKIKSIDSKAAEKVQGVLKILTHKNAPKIPWYGMSYLFDPHLRFEGDEVAVVVAETEQIAEDALKLIQVEYEKLPFVTDAGAAMEDSAPQIHDSGNIAGGEPDRYSRGDIEEGFGAADFVQEDTFNTQVVIHNPTEVHCSTVNWDGDDLVVWDSTQGIFGVRDTVARSLKIPANKVRIIKKYMGGGFGAKLTTGKYTVMAALAARDIGRPVKIAVDRRAMNLAVGNRPDSVQTLKIGAKKDGTLTAISHSSYGAAGAYPSGAGCSWPARSMYQCPNVFTEDYTVFINAGPGRPFRAPGHPQGTFALDSILDDVAEKLDIDPMEFRLRNFAEQDQVSNQPYTSKLLKEAYEKGSQAIGWEKRRSPAGSDEGPIKSGIGMASQIWWGGGGPPAGATIRLNRDGSIRVIAGTQDIGTGTYTIMAQVAAEVLEIPMEKVEVILGDTAVAPYCGGSGGSTTAASVTPAVRNAAEKMKAKLISGAAAVLEVPENQLTYNDGVITDSNDGETRITISEIVRELREQVLITNGARGENPDGYSVQTFGAQFADVSVDTETGIVTVNRIVASHDIGRVLNRKTLENQFHGGMIQGMSYALMEERVIDQNTGKVLTTNLHNYKLPTVKDIPEMEIIIVSESDDMVNSTGVKGIGEPAIIPTAAAIANAVYNAIGVRIKSLPITPDKVLNALYG
ncbi:MAG: xanthine dehydrogenase family protein molybdopterin-binding subunit [Candidatus Marinimicrobia bacterium]|nr:xanthine dehydrogenase family protein molybdopterin-binding subunit [Candidatus Neomarinimicrobiota bacterium]MCF7829539.1 xanthine dehydrogenase family protein molybdopterin-binding subunit [Candidatus Neomarinimicrobiota bacterium]MCF7880063.1 xanthine dehydrogenase family protein molybdopterin-binding subunit [Candidatus Neomarinimicrobiota bacterium]